MNESIFKHFIKYVSQNILGMLGISCYIIVDTFFIAQAAGSNGITVLNLVLPIFNLIFAFGAMMGVGAATRFAILRAQGDESADGYFSNAVFFALIIGVWFVLAGILFPEKILQWMGGDAEIIRLGVGYTRIFISFAPFFMLNHIVSAFVRNDNAPTLAMVGTIAGSLSNVLFDYIFMFVMNFGLDGAAMATVASPILSILVCSMHFLQKKNTIRFVWKLPSMRLLWRSCRLGVASFIGELSSGVITTTYNFLILDIAGNIGVAAYGVVANYAMVATALFNGVAQGSQPLVSECYGRGDKGSQKKLLGYGLKTVLGIALLLIAVVYAFTDAAVLIFNSENSALMAEYAHEGLRIYFVGFLFAGYNIMGAGFLSATEQAEGALLVSLSRGVVVILITAILLAKLMGFLGVWMAFGVAEAITAVITTVKLIQGFKGKRNVYIA
ncbi:MAG: MATE family efflux transporter [Lachnospiraceae bacterium]